MGKSMVIMCSVCGLDNSQMQNDYALLKSENEQLKCRVAELNSRLDSLMTKYRARNSQAQIDSRCEESPEALSVKEPLQDYLLKLSSSNII